MERRLTKEFNELNTQALPGVTVEQNPNDKLNWVATINGPQGTPYEVGKFKLNIKFPEQYPFKPPEFQFITPIFHPNITDKGEVCQDMIGAKDWQPTRTTRQTIELILNMLAQPNSDQSLNNEAMALYKSDKNKFEERVKNEALKNAK